MQALLDILAHASKGEDEPYKDSGTFHSRALGNPVAKNIRRQLIWLEKPTITFCNCHYKEASKPSGKSLWVLTTGSFTPGNTVPAHELEVIKGSQLCVHARARNSSATGPGCPASSLAVRAIWASGHYNYQQCHCWKK